MNPLLMRQGLVILLIFFAMMYTGMITIEKIIFGLPAVIIALSFHEFAHAFAAVRLGDPTPKFQGRLSIDIRKHIDPWGLLFFIIAGFGWAKPVETNPRNLKNPKRDMAIIASAGPIMNILLAIVTLVIFLEYNIDPNSKIGILFQYIFLYNAGFAVFNLIPIPPLDGSKIITIFMPSKTYYKYLEFEYKYQMYLIIGLIALVFLAPNVLGNIIYKAIVPIQMISIAISNLLPF